jgi:predicted Zn-dependent protease
MNFRRLITAATLACAAALAGCSNVNPVTGKTIYTPFTPTLETYYGSKAHQEMIDARGAYTEDADLTAYVNRVGRAVAKGAVRRGIDYTFTILDSDEINAHALPGGYVYITRGALAFANNEAEVAALLGHEIGHVDAFHFREKKHDTMNVLLSVLLRNSSIGANEIELAEKLVAASAGSSVYSQDQEYEADALGIHYMAAAGYDPQAMISMMRTDEAKTRLDGDDMKGNAVAREILSLNLSHPQTPDRVARAIEAAKTSPVKTAGNPGAIPAGAGRDAYLAAVDGMMFGPDPAEGTIEGRQLTRPGFEFSFSAPQGFDLWNLHSQAIGLSSTAFLVLELGKPVANGLMTDYVAHAMVTDATVQNVRMIDTHGLEAATGIVTHEMFTMRLAAIRDQARHLYRLAFVAPTKVFHDLDKDFIASIESFRHVETAEAGTAPKMRLHVVTVGAGDTVESLAARMAVQDKKLDWFRVLNGLGEADAVQRGEKVKVVVAE